jgi:hypothetical protein
MWLGVTANPSAEWIARQLTEACGWEATPNYIVRDRDCAYGKVYVQRLRAIGVTTKAPTAEAIGTRGRNGILSLM